MQIKYIGLQAWTKTCSVDEDRQHRHGRSLSMDMQHIYGLAVLTQTYSMDKYMLHVYVHAHIDVLFGYPRIFYVFMSMLNVHFHAACPCPCPVHVRVRVHVYDHVQNNLGMQHGNSHTAWT